MTKGRPIVIAAAIIVDEDGRTLLVRKRGTASFMQAGGKIDAGEEPEAALRRELLEELGSGLAGQPTALGTRTAPAANEPDFEVVAHLFEVELSEPPAPAAEIAEMIWVSPEKAKALDLAPLTRHHVLPIVEQMQ